MNNEFESNEKMSGFLPLVLVTLTLVLLIFFQLSAMFQQGSALRNIIAQQAPAVQQAQQAQQGLQKLATDLLRAAETDQDAQAIVKEFGISMAGGAAQPAAPEATPAQ